MATKTQYYNLDKPNYDEVADIEIINANMDKIDTQMRNNADGVNFAKDISSDAYDNSKSYAVGDYCIYNNKLYRCITAIESAEAFNVEKWEQTTVGKEVKQLNSNLNNHNSDTTVHITSTERTNWNTAKTHADSVHARTDATKVSKSSTNGNVLINGSETNVYTHPSGTNPHGTTKSDVGLSNVENKSSATILEELTKSNVTKALGYTPLDSVLKGSNNGVAELDSNGKVPASQLPSYVDDVIEGYFSGGKFYKESSHSTVITGESGKIYIDLHTEKTYRWTGTIFGVVSETLSLGETSSTAYRGDRGKTAYDHSQSIHAPSNAQANVIETVQVNGTALTPSSKAVNVPVPTKVSELDNDLDFISHIVGYIQIGNSSVNGYIDMYYNNVKTRVTGNNTLTSGAVTVRFPAKGGTLAISSSDVRLKDNVKDTTVNGLETINKIKVRQFDWNNNEENGNDRNTHQDIGFVADELEELDSRLAVGGGENEDGEMNIKGVDMFYMLGYVVKAIQELSQENELLKDKIKTLEN